MRGITDIFNKWWNVNDGLLSSGYYAFWSFRKFPLVLKKSPQGSVFFSYWNGSMWKSISFKDGETIKVISDIAERIGGNAQASWNKVRSFYINNSRIV